jgi:hypothetical protein
MARVAERLARLPAVPTMLAMLAASRIAAAACAMPLVPPQTFARTNWAELERFQAAANLNPLIQEVQALRSRGHGAVNNDYYGITIDKRSDTAESVMSLLRRELSTVIFQGTSYSVEPRDAANAQRWSSPDPHGVIMSFTLAAIPGVMPLERGSVVVSCISPTDFVFSTVRTDRDGWHPVAGNRAFGVRDNGNGSLTIWTKAADRVVDAGLFGALPEALREEIFNQGHAVWLRLLDNLQRRFADRNPRDRTVFSERRRFD